MKELYKNNELIIITSDTEPEIVNIIKKTINLYTFIQEIVLLQYLI
mgnify:CR=1 FL=1